MKIKKESSIFKYKKFYTFDIETYIKTKKFRVACLFDGEKDYKINKMSEFIDFFVSLQNKNNIVYSHFGGGFDFNYILETAFAKYNIQEFSSSFSGSLPIYTRLKIGNINIELRDSFALFRTSLNNVTKALINETKIEIDIENLDIISDKIVYDYCKQDTIILWRALDKWRKLIDTDFKLSSASQSMDIFTKKFLKYEWPKLNKYQIELLSQYNYAGRTEVIKRECTNGVFIDINNHYPNCMKTFGAPIGKPIETTKEFNNAYGMYTIVLEKEPNLYLPFLPTHYNNKLFFFNAKNYNYNVTSFELDLLKNYNIPYKIKKGFVFDKGQDFFADYIDYWIEIRYKNPELKFVSKIMLNSLSGKFAEKINHKRLILDTENECESYLNPELKIGYLEEEKINDYNNPQISGFIWSAGRYILFNYLKKYYNDVCYCDTDSLVIPEDKIDYYDIDDKILGKLKVERKFEYGIFLSQKFYGLKNVIEKNDLIDFKFKIKGFDIGGFSSEKIEKNITFENFSNALLKNELKFELEKLKLSKLKTALKNNEFVMYNETKKVVRALELKRKLLPDKINTVPYFLRNGELQ